MTDMDLDKFINFICISSVRDSIAALSNVCIDDLACLVESVDCPQEFNVYLPLALKVYIWRSGQVDKATRLVNRYINKYGINHSFVVESMWSVGMIGSDDAKQIIGNLSSLVAGVVDSFMFLGERFKLQPQDDIGLDSLQHSLESSGLVVRSVRLYAGRGELYGFDFGYPLSTDSILVLQRGMQLRFAVGWIGEVWLVRYPNNALVWSMTLKQCSRIIASVLLDSTQMLVENDHQQT